MSCREVIDFLSEYMEGTLPWHQRALFMVHLGLCRDCRHYLASFRHTMELARTMGKDFSADRLSTIPSALLQAIQAARK